MFGGYIMGVGLTGVETPFDGEKWSYMERREKTIPFQIAPDQKIKVFISSICGIEKYDTVRAELKNVIEATELADVYLFERKDAATLPAEAHYSLALEDSDICIFLIDNADGIKSGVQAEIDIVKKKNIKALYYFCDENSTKKTALEQSLMGASFAKSKTIHKFKDLSREGAYALINDIITVYHYYCKDKIALNPIADGNELQHISIAGTEKMQVPTVPKIVLKNVEKCKEYILNFTTGHSVFGIPDELEESSEIDDWCVQFFSILFEGQSIKNYNTGMFLEILKKHQTEKHHRVVQMRWQAIQSYFLGDVATCVESLENVLKFAKESNQPAWIIKDILVDLRNQCLLRDTIENYYSESEAQKELCESNEEVYYPILDRINESLYEKYIESLYDEKMKSPYTMTFGNDLEQYGKLLASAYIVSMYNGSLTHIILLYKKIRDFLFFLNSKYDDWNLRRDLLKLAIYEGKEKEIKGIQDSYPEVLNNLNAMDALTIMKFCDNHPVKHERFISRLWAFGTVGYYLSNKDYGVYETLLLDEIKEWLNDSKAIIFIGKNIFSSLSGVAYRMSQDALAEICCMFIDKHYSRWFTDMFNFIANRIDLRKMCTGSSERLIKCIIKLFDDDNQRVHIKSTPHFLYILRNQSREVTEDLDKKVAEYFPEYFNGDYKLKTMKKEVQDLSKFLIKYVQRIQHSNDTQGKNGIYFGHGSRDIAVVRSILHTNDINFDEEIMDTVISTVAYTLLVSKEEISTKLDAVSLLICIIVKYTDDYKRNFHIFKELHDKKDNIKIADNNFMSSNIDSISLDIGLQFLFSAMDIDTYFEILELMPYIQNDIPTTISVTRMIAEYLEVKDDVVLPKKIEAIVLQNVLQWLCSSQLDIRWNATRILLKMVRNPENSGVVNHQLTSLVDSGNVYTKNLIMRNIFKENGIWVETRNHIISKCENDASYIVRMVCEEVKNDHI